MALRQEKKVTVQQLPQTIPIFPLSGALLLPSGHLPLNIFEPRYIAMIDAALSGSRLIGMVQPAVPGVPATSKGLCTIGCAGRLVSFNETDDGRYIIALNGLCRFKVKEELETTTAFRQIIADWTDFADDLKQDESRTDIDRALLLKTFKNYLDHHKMDVDWDSVAAADTGTLVNALSMMSPYGEVEKQILLEAKNTKERADTLVAITEILLAKQDRKGGMTLQ